MTDRSAVTWRGDTIEIVDQTLLPQRLVISQLRSLADAIEAIRSLRVRGAPAIGVCGAFALVLGLQLESGSAEQTDRGSLHARASALAEQITSTRPTAVNLPWAVGRVRDAALHGTTAAQVLALAEREALAVQRETSDACRRIGEFGREELQGAPRLLTHCNTGWLATNGRGTALAIVYAKHERGEPVDVLVSETRPLMQGARLTAWETARGRDTRDDHDRGGGGGGDGHTPRGRGRRRLRPSGTQRRHGQQGGHLCARCRGGREQRFRSTSQGRCRPSTRRSTSGTKSRSSSAIPTRYAGSPAWCSHRRLTHGTRRSTSRPSNLIAGFITEAGVLRPPFVDSIASALGSAERVTDVLKAVVYHAADRVQVDEVERPQPRPRRGRRPDVCLWHLRQRLDGLVHEPAGASCARS